MVWSELDMTAAFYLFKMDPVWSPASSSEPWRVVRFGSAVARRASKRGFGSPGGNTDDDGVERCLRDFSNTFTDDFVSCPPLVGAGPPPSTEIRKGGAIPQKLGCQKLGRLCCSTGIISAGLLVTHEKFKPC